MLRLRIEYDSDTENPLEWDQWELISFSNRHVNFRHPDEVADDDEIQERLADGRAFCLSYYEHGLCRWSLRGEGPQCRWDSVTFAGVLVWWGDKDEFPDITKAAKQTLDSYTDWCNGQCFYYCLERLHKCEHCGQEDEAELLDSCGGFIGVDYFAEELRRVLSEYPDEELIVVGDAADITHYHDLRKEQNDLRKEQNV